MAVRTPTTAATAARSAKTAAAVPQNVHVAAFYASMEWWRVKAGTLGPERSTEPFHVLSIANGSPDYDREVVVSLKAHFPNLKYTIVEPSRAHSRLASDAAVSKLVTLSPAASFEEFAASAEATPGGKKAKKGAKGKGGGFDVIHVALWRNQSWAKPADMLRLAASLLNAHGTLVTFGHGDDGAFQLRETFKAELKPALAGSASLGEEAVVGTLFNVGLAPKASVLPSLVDITSCVNFKASPLVYRTMADLTLCDMEAAAKASPALLPEVFSALRDSSVASTSTRCVVYTPLSVVVSVKSASSPFAPPAPRFMVMEPAVDPWWPHGPKGGFLNQGLHNWHNIRNSWKNYDPDAERAPKPPLKGVEEVVEGLSKLRRTFELPAPMALSDILDIYIDIWDSE